MLASSWSWPLILSSNANANVDGSVGGGDATALELVRRARRHEDGQQLVCNVSHHFLRFLGSRCRSSWMVFVLLRRRRIVPSDAVTRHGHIIWLYLDMDKPMGASPRSAFSTRDIVNPACGQFSLNIVGSGSHVTWLFSIICDPSQA
jgi:hypothetical protein